MLLGLVIGSGMTVLVMNLAKKANLGTTRFERSELDKVSADSLQNIMDTARSILLEKEKPKFDSLKKLGEVRDSLLVAKGKASLAMLDAPITGALYRHLDSLRYSIILLVDSCDDIIMQASLDMLRPSNEGLRALVKEIGDEKDKLNQEAKTVGTIADIVSAITAILAAPILAPVAPAAAK